MTILLGETEKILQINRRIALTNNDDNKQLEVPFKRWKKCNEIQLTKKNDFNNQKMQ